MEKHRDEWVAARLESELLSEIVIADVPDERHADVELTRGISDIDRVPSAVAHKVARQNIVARLQPSLGSKLEISVDTADENNFCLGCYVSGDEPQVVGGLGYSVNLHRPGKNLRWVVKSRILII